MKVRTFFIIACLLAAAASFAAPAQVSRLPVAGEFFDPALGGEVAWEGDLTLVWTPAEGASSWDVQGVFVARARVKATGVALALQGFSRQRVAGSPGDAVAVVPPDPVAALGGGTWRPVALDLGAGLPATASIPASWALAAAPGPAALDPVVVPVKGQYPAAEGGGQVTYEGVITLFWTPPGGETAGWTVRGSLVADARATATGERFVVLGYCSDCFAMPRGSTITMTKPVFAIGVGNTLGFLGTVSMDLALAPGAAVPTVGSVTLASR